MSGALPAVLAASLLAGGLGLVAVGLRQRRPASDVVDYLRGLDEPAPVADEFHEQLNLPFLARVVRPLGTRFVDRVASLSPPQYLDRIHQQLLHAGLAASMRAEEFAGAQVVVAVAGVLGGFLVALLLHPRLAYAALILVLLSVIGILSPAAWLRRREAERQEAIFKDLPDTLDLLAISVEAGLGFEQALAVVCKDFSSPLAEEFSRSLREMELGLPRREALQNLKRRTEVPELSNFVLALTQADALGMPIGRVLHSQATEMRVRRKQWAREKAAKLPVKILFPLVFFIFPAILVVILGPAAASIIKGFAR
jgi:tight adherence protein C